MKEPLNVVEISDATFLWQPIIMQTQQQLLWQMVIELLEWPVQNQTVQLQRTLPG